MITMHPGEYLKMVYLEPNNETQKSLADRLGVSPSALSRLIEGKAAMTTEMAVRLEKTLDRSAESWMYMQVHYGLQQARMALNEKSVACCD